MTESPLAHSTIAVPILDASTSTWAALGHERRGEMCAFVRAHDLDPNHVKAVEPGLVDMPFLTVTVFDTNEAGRHFVDEATDAAAVYRVEVPMRQPLPAWWTPDAYGAAS
jgi:hypothetical protein